MLTPVLIGNSNLPTVISKRNVEYKSNECLHQDIDNDEQQLFHKEGLVLKLPLENIKEYLQVNLQLELDSEQLPLEQWLLTDQQLVDFLNISFVQDYHKQKQIEEFKEHGNVFKILQTPLIANMDEQRRKAIEDKIIELSK